MNARKESLGKEAVVSCVDMEGPDRTGAEGWPVELSGRTLLVGFKGVWQWEPIWHGK